MPEIDRMLTDGFMDGLLNFYYTYCAVIFLVTAVTYILQAVSLHRIAKRRWIRHPWLAWIPVGFDWILGSISDQYQYVVKGKVENKRKALLIVQMLKIVCSISLIVCLTYFFAQFAIAIAHNTGSAELMQTATLVVTFCAAVLIINLSLAVIQYMALYDLYRSCDPEFRVLYLLLSIFINGATPILLIICSGKDKGMPPRKVQVTDTPELPRQEETPAVTYEWQPPEETTEE